MTAATTAPRLGQEAVTVDTADDGDLTLWSVTTILGALDKPALLYWAAEQTADAAIDNIATWQAMLTERGRAEAVKWLRDARFRRPRNKLSAKDLGTVVHQLCEEYALTGARPDRNRIAELIRVKGGEQVDVRAEGPVVLAMLQQFDSWLQRFTPAYVATEVAVYSPTYGYAGQSDGFVVIDGTRMIIDYKTSREPRDSKGDPRTPYPEQVGLQLAAYRWAEFAAVWRPRRLEKFRRRYYLLGDAERAMAEPVPQVDGGLAIQITPESCEAYPIRCDEEAHRAFLFTIEVFRWLQETSKNAMGPALESAGD
jgi:ATP-dependent exoDNAse (exonuclease V) beta subunit